MIQEEKISQSAEDEIRELEQKLAEKKRVLAEGGATPREEKEVFREVMREHIGEKMPSSSLPASPPVSKLSAGAPLMPGIAPIRNAADDVAREAKVAALVERAMTTSIEAAVRAAQAESPYLVDALHDRLADEYYDKLIQLRKLESL